MTFPVRTDGTPYAGSAATSHAIPLPASISAGEVLLAVCINGGGTGTIGVPTNWTNLFNNTIASGGNLSRLRVVWKVADGAEGSDVTFSFGASLVGGGFACKWSGASSIEINTRTTGTNNSPNPGSLAPSWPTDDTQWIALAHAVASGDLTAAPTNYGGLLGTGGIGFGAKASAAFRGLNTSSEDPGAFTLAGTVTAWQTVTLGVQPAPPGQPIAKRMAGIPHLGRGAFTSRGVW